MFTDAGLAKIKTYYLDIAIKEFYQMSKDITLSGLPDDETLMEVLRLREYPTMSSSTFKALVTKNIDKFTKALFLNYLNGINVFFDVIKASLFRNVSNKNLIDFFRDDVTIDQIDKIEEIINIKGIDNKRDAAKFLVEFILVKDNPEESHYNDCVYKENSLLKERWNQCVINVVNELERHLTVLFSELNTRQEMVTYLQYVSGIITVLFLISTPHRRDIFTDNNQNFSTGLIPKGKKISISPEIALLSVTMNHGFNRKPVDIYDIDKPGTTSYSDHALKFYNRMISRINSFPER